MKYQDYKNKMLKVKKVMNFFYRFRFVFIGVAVSTAATITTLDLTKGNITEVSDFQVSYVYGDEIKCSGSAFMGNVTFEYRRHGESDDDWSEEQPRFVGEYEVRARSEGNHGYKYSDITTFEIKPYPTAINLLNTSIDFGNDHPKLTYSLLPGDALSEEDVVVNYDSLEERTTVARINLDSLNVIDKDGVDVTACYQFNTEDKEITFNQQKIAVEFIEEGPFSYTGNYYSSNSFKMTSGTLFYGAHLEYTGGRSECKIDTYDNNHHIIVVGDDGTNYTNNYDIDLYDNHIQIDPAPAVTITSSSLSKEHYDGKAFSDFAKYTDGQIFNADDLADPDSLIKITPSLLPGHYFKLITFNNKNVYQAGAYDNSFEFDIVDDAGNSVDRTLYTRITPVSGKINIGLKPITIVSCATSATFDNKYHSLPDYEKPVEGLVEGDEIVVNLEEGKYIKQKLPTTGVANVLEYTIKHGDDDVTSSYDINTIWNNITITVDPLKFVFSTSPITYDGQDHSYYYAEGNYDIYTTDLLRQNAALLDESFQTLPEGWTYDVRVSNSLFKRKNVVDAGYKVTIDDIEVHIWDDSEPAKIDVGSQYIKGTDILFEIPEAYILKKDLDIEVTDYNKQFDNRTIEQDIVINPNDPGTCVTFSGLADSDSPDVKFADNTAKNKVANNYTLNLSYGTKDKTTYANTTDNYNLHFANNKQTIDASIAKRDIIVDPSNLDKVYNGVNTFTPPAPTFKAPDGKALLGTEAVSIKTQTAAPYTTSQSIIGDYTYSLNTSDIVIKINNEDVTSSYNVFSPNTGHVYVNQRDIAILNNNRSGPESHIFYDKKPHGVFVDEVGQSLEMTVEQSNAEDTRGLISGHRLAVDNPQSITAVGHLEIDSSYDLAFKIYDSTNANVTDNYNIYHSSFYIDIVQTKVTITPKAVGKTFDGSYFDTDFATGVGFGVYRNYTTAEMDLLYNVTIESTVNNNQLQAGHVLQLTKYTKECADEAIDASYSGYPFYYSWRIIDTNDNNKVIQEYPELNGVYAVEAPQGLHLLYVDYATVRINCNAGGKTYDGKVGVPPKSGNSFVLDTDDTADAYISSYVTGPKFFNNFAINAKFDTGLYDPNEMWRANEPGESYKFPVTITITNKNTSTTYSESGISSVNIIKNKSYYDYTINKLAITLSTSISSDGRELRRVDISIPKTDKLCFGTIDDYEFWENKRKQYGPTHTIDKYFILRNGVDVTEYYIVTIA